MFLFIEFLWDPIKISMSVFYFWVKLRTRKMFIQAYYSLFSYFCLRYFVIFFPVTGSFKIKLLKIKDYKYISWNAFCLILCSLTVRFISLFLFVFGKIVEDHILCSAWISLIRVHITCWIDFSPRSKWRFWGPLTLSMYWNTYQILFMCK